LFELDRKLPRLFVTLSYKLDDGRIRVLFLAGAREYSLLHNVQTASGAYPASYTIGFLSYFLGAKAAGA
jgi:hypothetical protein